MFFPYTFQVFKLKSGAHQKELLTLRREQRNVEQAFQVIAREALAKADTDMGV